MKHPRQKDKQQVQRPWGRMYLVPLMNRRWSSQSQGKTRVRQRPRLCRVTIRVTNWVLV